MPNYTEEDLNEVRRECAAQLQQLIEHVSELTAERDALAATLKEATNAYLAQDHATIDAMIAESVKTEKQREVDAATAERDEAQAKLDALTR